MTITIGELTEDNPVAQSPAHGADEIGPTVQTATPRVAEQFGARPGEGVMVTQVRSGSIAAMVGIEPGAVILQVNRKAVGSAAEFRHAVKEGSKRRRVLLLVRKDDIQRDVVLGW